MANTYTHLLYHCIWSTKNRKPLIPSNVESQIWAIVAETAKTHGMFLKKAGGIENHIHVLIEIPKTLSVSEAMKRLKGGSSNAIQQSGLISKEFAWQIGYAAFTVSKSAGPEVSRYISTQREHHRSKTFEEELIALLGKHEIEFDRKYVFD
jgi:REP element-mobilizing transposase RayT